MNITQRIAIGALSLSAAGFVSKVTYEGFTSNAVVPTKGDRWTYGNGSTFKEDGSPVQKGDTITPVAAARLALSHLQKDEKILKSCIKTELHQGEYDLLIDHAYQYGPAVTCRSPMVQEINRRNYKQACEGYKSYRFMTSPKPLTPLWNSSTKTGWEPTNFIEGKPTRWRFDCSQTINGKRNTQCWGVWQRSLDRYNTCMSFQ
jgi:GH24 family phage-related lysozyme (muramidase)